MVSCEWLGERLGGDWEWADEQDVLPMNKRLVMVGHAINVANAITFTDRGHVRVEVLRYRSRYTVRRAGTGRCGRIEAAVDARDAEPNLHDCDDALKGPRCAP